MSEERLPQLHMRLPALTDLPALDLPPGFRLRTATRSECPALARVLGAAFPEMEWTTEKAENALFDDPAVMQVFVIEDETVPQLVATASARALPAQFPDAGYVHWVGADPAYQGRGLGRAVSLGVLHEFVRLGFTAAVLHTDDFRRAAIRTYLKLGFVPNHTHPSHVGRWATIFADSSV